MFSENEVTEGSISIKRRKLLQKVRNVDGRHYEALKLILAAILGIIAGFGAIVFRFLIELIQQLAFSGNLAPHELSLLPYYSILIPPLIGGAIVGPLVYFFAPEAKGHGVPEVKDACANKGGRIRPRVVFIKTLASGISIGTGGSVGREGPIVQIGAALGSFLGKTIGLRGGDLIDFVAAGSAAGIAATFNAPIAGVVFAVEIILGRSSPRHFTPLVVSSVMATVVVHWVLGTSPALWVPAYHLNSAWELPLYVVLGFMTGLVGLSFTKGLYGIEDIWDKFPGPRYIHGAIGGLFVGTLALQFPEVLGVGYELIEGVLGATHAPLNLTNDALIFHLFILIGIKILATGITIGSGGSGGVFAPSLFLGASAGGAFGGLAKKFLPRGIVDQPSAYALVGMGGVVGATTHAPLTAILIVFELTNRHSIILPLMLTTVVSTAISMALGKESIYTLKLLRRGARLNDGRDLTLRVRNTPVSELMIPSVAYVSSSATIEKIVHRAHLHDTHDVYVVDENKSVMGVVSMDDVASHFQDKLSLRKQLRAFTLMHAVPTIHEETSLEVAIKALKPHHRDQLPVINKKSKLVGVVLQADLLSYYSRELIKQEAILEMVGDGERNFQEIEMDPDELQSVILVGAGFENKTLGELNLRTRFGVTVYAIRDHSGRAHVPNAESRLLKGQTLVVIGPESEIEHIKNMAS